MRVLSIVPFPVLPLTHGGRVRAYRLATGLARAGASVDLCCPWHPGLSLRAFERDGIRIRPFLFAGNALPALLGDSIVPPLLQLSWQPYTFGPRRLVRQSRDYDLVEFHFCAYPTWMSRIAKETRVVYSAHNVELDYALAKPASSVHRLLGRSIGRLERHAVHASDLVVTCTEADGKRLAQLYGEVKKVAVVSNGFDEDDIGDANRLKREESRAELGLEPNELAILFIGGPAAHNRRAVQFLENELLPQLGRPARLLVAGQCTRPRRRGRVLALGRIDSLLPLLAAADVAVNPIDSGSGSNVKLADYLAAGLPVVTTPIGLRGYEAFAHLMTIAELQGFATAVAAMRPLHARRPAPTELSWRALGQRLYDIYTELLAQAPGTRPL